MFIFRGVLFSYINILFLFLYHFFVCCFRSLFHLCNFIYFLSLLPIFLQLIPFKSLHIRYVEVDYIKCVCFMRLFFVSFWFSGSMLGFVTLSMIFIMIYCDCEMFSKVGKVCWPFRIIPVCFRIVFRRECMRWLVVFFFNNEDKYNFESKRCITKDIRKICDSS